MPLTPYSDVDELLNSLLHRLQRILGTRLIAVYLYGSLVTGDFDVNTSDIDLLSVTASDIEDEEFEQLQQMHHDLVDRSGKWDGRIEIAYVSVAALKTFKSQTSRIAVISPGEPFHLKEAGIDWLINWWVVRQKGIALLGPPAATLIDPISKEEFLHAVQEQAEAWAERINREHTRPSQAYAILTLCRALYAVTCGEQASKKQAALWAQDRLPQWAPLIGLALVWRDTRQDENAPYQATLAETVRFVRFVAGQIRGP